MQLTSDDVRKVAVLAHLEFSDSEIEQFTDQLGKIVNFVRQLASVPTEGVEQMAHPLDVHTVLRPDEPSPSISTDAALSNSPNHDAEFFLVPPVMANRTRS